MCKLEIKNDIQLFFFFTQIKWNKRKKFIINEIVHVFIDTCKYLVCGYFYHCWWCVSLSFFKGGVLLSFVVVVFCCCFFFLGLFYFLSIFKIYLFLSEIVVGFFSYFCSCLIYLFYFFGAWDFLCLFGLGEVCFYFIYLSIFVLGCMFVVCFILLL